MPFPDNHPTIADLTRLEVRDIAALPADVLVDLQQEADGALKAAKTGKARLDEALALKYADRAAALRAHQGKDTGTVRVEDGAVTVVADLPKKVDWDQAQLAALVERIRAEGDDPVEYVDIAFKVPERKFAAWPSAIRSAFEAARTVRVGKPSFRLSLNDEVSK